MSPRRMLAVFESAFLSCKRHFLQVEWSSINCTRHPTLLDERNRWPADNDVRESPLRAMKSKTAGSVPCSYSLILRADLYGQKQGKIIVVRQLDNHGRGDHIIAISIGEFGYFSVQKLRGAPKVAPAPLFSLCGSLQFVAVTTVGLRLPTATNPD